MGARKVANGFTLRKSWGEYRDWMSWMEHDKKVTKSKVAKKEKRKQKRRLEEDSTS